ncbi:MAG: InlB B-repeat-containing protein, partial [Clostridiales bacterium]|nr:InlB B-repeat-containing protein [Clostridiales bacterium]
TNFHLPDAPPKRAAQNYGFDGWAYPGGATKVQAGAAFPLTEDITFTATWRVLPQYTLSFSGNGGTLKLFPGFVNSTKFYEGTDITEIVMGSTATRAKYTFLGWSFGVVSYPTDYVGNIGIMKNTSLLAVWEEITYQLTFDLAGGTGETLDGRYAQSKVVKMPVTPPQKDGLAFNGWKCTETGITVLAGGSFTMPGHDATLVAQWVEGYTVHFEKNGGEGEVPEDMLYPPNGKIKLPPATILTKFDHSFTNWACSADGKNYAANYTYTVIKDVTFTANFTPLKHKVKFNKNCTLSATVPSDTGSYETDATGTVKTPANPGTTALREKYKFVGWGFDPTDSPELLQQYDTFPMPQGGTNLYAYWVTMSKLTFNVRGIDSGKLKQVPAGITINGEDTFVTEITKVDEGINIYNYMFGTTLSCDNEEYIFLGWVNQADPSIVYTSDNPIIPMPANDVTYVAYWGQPFELTFNTNGGTGGPEGFSFYAGHDIKIPNEVPTKADHIFSGWEYGGGVIVFEGGTILNAPANDLELVAQWTALEIYIEYDANGGTGGPQNYTIDCHNSGVYVIPLSTPTKAGYSFKPWASTLGTYLNPGDSISYSPSMAGTTIVLTAEYERIVCILTYNANGGNGVMTDSNSPYYQLDTVTVMDNTFKRPTYNFIGFNTKANGSGVSYNGGDTFTINENTTLYAQWEFIGGEGPFDYDVEYTVFDAFNNESLGVEKVVLWMGLNDSLTINSSNFTDYFPGCKPYSASNGFNATYSVTFTTQNGAISSSAESVSVYRFVNISDAEYVKLTTHAGLNNVAKDATHMGKNYQMQNDISCSDKFTPLGWVNGSSATRIPFAGIFDGNNKQITGFNADWGTSGGNQKYVGLFANNAGTIKNVKLVGNDNILALTYTGGIAAYNNGSISNCSIKLTTGSIIRSQEKNIQSGDGFAGGIVGYNDTSGTITNCISDVPMVSAHTYCGGIAGLNRGSITDCESVSGINDDYAASDLNYGSIGLYHAGGITGANYGNVTNCTVPLTTGYYIYASGFTGGIAGSTYNGSTISGCVVKLSGYDTCINARVVVGGIVGANLSGATITDSHIWMNNSNNEVAAAVSTTYTVGSESLQGSFAGGIAGINEGNIKKSTIYSPTGAWVYTWGPDYSWYDYVGGIAGVNCGSISECWGYNVKLNEHLYPVYYLADIQYHGRVGGITGGNRSGGTINDCWMWRVELVSYKWGGGLVGEQKAGASINNCWVYCSGASGSVSHLGDSIPSPYCAGSYSNIVIWDGWEQMAGTRIGTNYPGADALRNMLPAELSSDKWEASPDGPMLKNNPLVTTR